MRGVFLFTPASLTCAAPQVPPPPAPLLPRHYDLQRSTFSANTPRHPRLSPAELPTETEVFLKLLIKVFAQEVETLRIDPCQDEGTRNGNHARVRLRFSITFTYVLIMDPARTYIRAGSAVALSLCAVSGNPTMPFPVTATPGHESSRSIPWSPNVPPCLAFLYRCAALVSPQTTHPRTPAVSSHTRRLWAYGVHVVESEPSRARWDKIDISDSPPTGYLYLSRTILRPCT